MENQDKKYPEFDNNNQDRDRVLKDDLDETIDTENLAFNEEADSFELDVKSEDPDYDHPDPYDTAAPHGEDDNSTWDEANIYSAKGEYDADRSLETDAEGLGMHIVDENSLDLNSTDKALAHTPEDDRDDLDEEGYPKNDEEL